jgi:hypothetical protein
MQWPKDLHDKFTRALDLKPMPGYTKPEIIQYILDETARRAVWRAECKPERMSGCLRWPYTPLGSVVPCGLMDRVKTVSLGGNPYWGIAVDALHTYIETHAETICEAFQDEQEPYDDMSGRFS